jgi:hypothetical protein
MDGCDERIATAGDAAFVMIKFHVGREEAGHGWQIATIVSLPELFVAIE